MSDGKIEQEYGHIQKVQLEENEMDGKYLSCTLFPEGKEKVHFFMKLDNNEFWFRSQLILLVDAFAFQPLVRITFNPTKKMGAMSEIVAVRIQNDDA